LRNTLQSATRWLESLSPWPSDGFGLERIHALLAELGDPQRRYPAVHVVGTNGKSSTTRLTEALLADAGLAVGAYVSPHVRGWSERIRIRGEDADFDRAVENAQTAARIYRRSRVRIKLMGDASRIFEAVVRPTEDGHGDVEAERERVRKEIERSERMLANEKFVANATPEAVASEREKLAQYLDERDALG